MNQIALSTALWRKPSICRLIKCIIDSWLLLTSCQNEGSVLIGYPEVSPRILNQFYHPIPCIIGGNGFTIRPRVVIFQVLVRFNFMLFTLGPTPKVPSEA